jgi:hypothetical protein
VEKSHVITGIRVNAQERVSLSSAKTQISHKNRRVQRGFAIGNTMRCGQNPVGRDKASGADKGEITIVYFKNLDLAA